MPQFDLAWWGTLALGWLVFSVLCALALGRILRASSAPAMAEELHPSWSEADEESALDVWPHERTTQELEIARYDGAELDPEGNPRSSGTRYKAVTEQSEAQVVSIRRR